jgi:hypothetical protein
VAPTLEALRDSKRWVLSDETQMSAFAAKQSLRVPEGALAVSGQFVLNT